MTDKLILLALLSFIPQAYADDWLCRSESSQRRDNVILACGLGVSPSEAEARKIALDRAKEEFKSLCEDDEDCQERAVLVAPERTECTLADGLYRCYRLLSFTYSEDVAASDGTLGQSFEVFTKALGSPRSVIQHLSIDGSRRWTQVLYQGNVCTDPLRSCYLVVENDQIVELHDVILPSAK